MADVRIWFEKCVKKGTIYLKKIEITIGCYRSFQNDGTNVKLARNIRICRLT